jgi:hypothetical protein
LLLNAGRWIKVQPETLNLLLVFTFIRVVCSFVLMPEGSEIIPAGLRRNKAQFDARIAV